MKLSKQTKLMLFLSKMRMMLNFWNFLIKNLPTWKGFHDRFRNVWWSSCPRWFAWMTKRQFNSYRTRALLGFWRGCSSSTTRNGRRWSSHNRWAMGDKLRNNWWPQANFYRCRIEWWKNDTIWAIPLGIQRCLCLGISRHARLGSKCHCHKLAISEVVKPIK